LEGGFIHNSGKKKKVIKEVWMKKKRGPKTGGEAMG